jgi:hypothetical protein
VAAVWLREVFFLVKIDGSGDRGGNVEGGAVDGLPWRKGAA